MLGLVYHFTDNAALGESLSSPTSIYNVKSKVEFEIARSKRSGQPPESTDPGHHGDKREPASPFPPRVLTAHEIKRLASIIGKGTRPSKRQKLH